MATNLQPTINDVLVIMSDLRGESSTNTDAVRIRAVSRANQDFARRMFWRFYLLKDQTTTGTAVNAYTIGSVTYPMRMKGLTEVFVALTTDTDKTTEADRYTVVDFNKYKNLYNQNNNAHLVYEYFDTANDLWKMHINPAPLATETITYSFYWEPPAKTSTADEIICPNVKILALMALADIYESEDEVEKSLDAKMEVEQLISEVVGRENAPAVNQIYTMGPTESSVSQHGIGTY